MRVTFWGTRGSIATPGRETNEYGGDTSCVAVTGRAEDHLLVLDAGTGIRRLGAAVPQQVRRIDVLLSHLHLDHIIGLGFFAPLYRAGVSVTLWGPPATMPLLDRLGRYLSPPLFPVRLRDVAADVELRDVPAGPMTLGEFSVSASPVIHTDPALGFRVESDGAVLAYICDHEPALGPSFPFRLPWTSGAEIARGADLLIHDAQYTAEEYPEHMGWGHSSVMHAVAFADLVGARTLALFHHDPGRDDTQLQRQLEVARRASRGVSVIAARQGSSIDVSSSGRRPI